MDQKQVVYIRNNERLLTIKWRLTTWCNYNCSYCVQTLVRKFDKTKKTDFDRLLSAAKDINMFLEESTRDVKILLIGGEVSWYDLETLIAAIPSKKLKILSFSTNLSNSSDYYISLAKYLHSRGITLDLVCSLHKEYVQPEAFINKVLHIREAAEMKSIRLEMVVNHKTEALYAMVKSTCEKNALDYRFDYDITESEEYRSHGLAVSSYKNPRYTVTFDDGTKDYTISNSQLLNLRNGQCANSRFLSEGFYCTRGLSYLSIDVDMVSDNDICIPREKFVPVRDYHLQTEPHLCTEKNGCLLYGDISIAKNKEDIDF